MKFLCISLFCIILFTGCHTKESNNKANVQAPDEFSFVFMTDIHLQPERGAHEAFKKVIDTVNKMDVDFVMTGGDLIYDVLRGNFNRSDSLFHYYKEAIKGFRIPVHNTIGNHELFGIYKESDIDSTHSDYKYGMYERYFGKTYYSFDYKNWHFISLNSIDERNKRYIGIINEEEQEWLKQDLAKLDKNKPIAIITHIPFVSAYKQIYPNKPATEAPNELWIYNRNEILKMFDDYNLKLVLQGHLHWVEDISVQNKTHFITGGTVAGRPSWRREDNRGDGIYYNQEGFMKVNISGENINWEYIDYGWESER